MQRCALIIQATSHFRYCEFIMALSPKTYILRFVSLEEGEVHFPVMKDTPLGESMKMFSERFGLQLNYLLFYLNKTRIQSDATPHSLRMKIGDYIHVLNRKRADTIREQAEFLKDKLWEEKEKRSSCDEDGGIGLKVVMDDVIVSAPPIHFRLKPTTSFEKLMRAYSEQSRIKFHQLKFTFKEEALNEDQTPQDLEMEPDDIITVQVSKLQIMRRMD